ncbi:MinD/ParA family protein [Desulfosarcina sp. OttesenSCG-928-G10]|nr:MinD/ParA family protein [Desulfosarcina sp. OttesenSCG-928-G10]
MNRLTFSKTEQVIHLKERNNPHTALASVVASASSVVSADADLTPARTIAITSGKGGVGKTNIVANLGYALCKAGKRVLIFDADLGLGNLDVLLGLAPRYNFSHVIKGEKTISEIIVDGPGSLKILPASSGIQKLTRLSVYQKMEIFNELNAVLNHYDIVLIDTAAGISLDVLYFNVSANEIMVVVTPDPTSITDAYALIKILSVKYAANQFRLLVNQVKDEKEAEDVRRHLTTVTNRFLDVSIVYAGSIPQDENVRLSVRKQKVVSEWAPMSDAARHFADLAHALIHSVPMEPDPDRMSLLWQEIM